MFATGRQFRRWKLDTHLHNLGHSKFGAARRRARTNQSTPIKKLEVRRGAPARIIQNQLGHYKFARGVDAQRANIETNVYSNVESTS